MTVTPKDIKGLGPVSINDLGMHGIWSVEDLANASIVDITNVPGFGAARAAQAKQAAADLLGTMSPRMSPAPKRARSAKKSVSDATSSKPVRGDATQVVAAAEDRDRGLEESAELIEQGRKDKKSKEKKSTKGEKEGRGKKKAKKKSDQKKNKDKKKGKKK